VSAAQIQRLDSGQYELVDRDRLLAAVSAAQLATGVAGMAIALERRHAYNFLLLHGRPEKVARDSLGMGTALSAPAVMLVAQGVAAARLLRRSPGPWNLILGALGATMVPGYLGESLVRRRLHPSSWDRVESPLAVTGIALAATMAVLGLTSRHRPA
jgi:hypothetical protein